MFRRWISEFYRKYKNKIELLGKVIFATFIGIAMFYLLIKNGAREKGVTENKEQTIYKPQETVISGSNITEQKYKEDSNVVDNFVKYCNEGNIDEAYNLLTNECKENLYPKLEDFKLKYCDRYFKTKRDYNLQSWIKNGDIVIYQMRITEDMLSTGKYQSDAYQDYITVVNTENGQKLNINGYVCRKEINKSIRQEGLEINVIRVDVYMDYEEYTIKVINNTSKVIMLDSMKNSAYTLRLKSNSNTYYSSRASSLSYTKLIVNPQENRKMEIQFNKKYTMDSSIKSIIFSQIVRDYTKFIKNQTEYIDFVSIQVDL